jgi:hypothetical protein
MLSEKEQLAWDLYNTHRNQREAAKEMGVPRRTFRRHFDAAKAKMIGTPVGFKTTKINTDQDGYVRSMTHKLAPEIDAPERKGTVIKTSTLYGADGSVVGEWVMRKPEDQIKDDYVAALDKHFVENVKRVAAPSLLTSDLSEKDLAVFLNVDEHIGVHLCAEQVGENYNLDDALTLMEDKFYQLVARTPKTERCLYISLGDVFHANDHMDVTPASKHPLHSSSTFGNVSSAVVALTRRKLELLLSHYGNVDVVGVAGNHDVDASGWLFRCLDIAYENEKRLSSVFASDGLGVYEFGKCMIGFHHGHQMKAEAMAGACADRYPNVYGRTNYRYLHTGHFHHDRSRDVWGGFKWECHRTMAPKDHFSYKNGYLSRQTMKSIVYNKEEGEVARIQTSLSK